MFHCNGWCFTWGVTAVGGTHVCLRAVEPGAHLGADRRARASPTTAARPPCRSASSTTRSAHRLDAAGHRHRRRGAPPSPDPARQAARARTSGPSTSTGSPRPTARTPCARGTRSGTRCPTTSRRGSRARQGQGYVRRRPRARGRRARCSDVPARRRDARRGRDARQQRDDGLLRAARGHGRGVPRRLVPLRRPRRLHPDGYIELRDRKKDIIISGGENISTIEVEQAVARHPAVLECAVVADPGRELGRAARRRSSRSRPGADGDRGGDHRVLPRAHRALQVPGGGRVRRPAEDLDRQDPEVRAARARVGRTRAPRQLTAADRMLAGRPRRGRRLPRRPASGAWSCPHDRPARRGAVVPDVPRSAPGEVVLRRPPRGELPRGAFDVVREHRVLSALADAETGVPVPRRSRSARTPRCSARRST